MKVTNPRATHRRVTISVDVTDVDPFVPPYKKRLVAVERVDLRYAWGVHEEWSYHDGENGESWSVRVFVHGCYVLKDGRSGGRVGPVEIHNMRGDGPPQWLQDLVESFRPVDAPSSVLP